MFTVKGADASKFDAVFGNLAQPTNTSASSIPVRLSMIIQKMFAQSF